MWPAIQYILHIMRVNFCTWEDVNKIETKLPMMIFLGWLESPELESQLAALSATVRPLESNFVESALSEKKVTLVARYLGGKSQFGFKTDGSFVCRNSTNHFLIRHDTKNKRRLELPPWQNKYSPLVRSLLSSQSRQILIVQSWNSAQNDGPSECYDIDCPYDTNTG